MEGPVDEMRPKMMAWAGALELQETTVSVEIDDPPADGAAESPTLVSSHPPSSAPTEREFHPVVNVGSAC
jgi:hypothetical protein